MNEDVGACRWYIELGVDTTGGCCVSWRSSVFQPYGEDEDEIAGGECLCARSADEYGKWRESIGGAMYESQEALLPDEGLHRSELPEEEEDVSGKVTE